MWWIQVGKLEYRTELYGFLISEYSEIFIATTADLKIQASDKSGNINEEKYFFCG